jgi:L-threonylcarbamoyladenylate synthase
VTERLLGTAGLARAAALLLEGELVAFGTETVYGLGADATNAAAVAQIFEAKGRPHFNPLICHYPDADAAFRDVMPNPTAERLAARFWPGPLTLVLPRRVTCRVALLAGAGLETLAVRVPSGTVALELLHAVGRSLAAPSANRSGQVSPTSAEHVLDGLGGRIAAVLDSGPCPVGIESTVLDLSAGAPFLLRPGGVTEEAIEAEIGRVGRALTPGRAEASRTLRSPGLLVSHYAPRLPVRLNARSATPDEAVLAFGPPPPGSSLLYQLSERAELAEAAARLFDGLRWLDAEGLARGSSGIAVSPIPDVGLGRAINDRLQRAAVAR